MKECFLTEIDPLNESMAVAAVSEMTDEEGLAFWKGR